MLYAFDFETALIQPGLQAPPPICMSMASELKAEVLPAPVCLDLFEITIESGDLLIGANTAFDMSVACAARPHLFDAIFQAYDEDLITDVLIRQKLIDIAMGEYRRHGRYNLATLTKRLCSYELPKEDTWRLRYEELMDVPFEDWPEDAITYSRMDAQATLDVYNAQEAGLIEVNKVAVLEDQYRQSRADFALKLASAWGLRTDKYGVAKLRKECEDRKAELEGGLLEEGLLKTTKKGVSKCIRVAQARMMEINPKAKLTKKGQELKLREVKYISVDAEACEDSGDPVLENYTEYSKIGSLLSGHVKAMEEGIETPLHTHFEVLLDTGRTSSSGPNVQNVRRAPGARECFIPRPGWVYIDCDFDKAELCTLAQCCIDLFGHSSLADALNGGFDPHTGLGARLAHTTYEKLLSRIKAGEDEAKEWRQRAKPGNFGFPGGMGPNGMKKYAKSTYGVIMTMEESEDLYAGWQDQWPEVAHDYLDWIKQLTSHTGHTTIEHFISKRWRGHVSYCVAANSFFQGRSADGMKAALWEVTKKCYTPGTALFGCRVVNEVHDEIMVEAPEAIAADAAWEMRDTMVKAYNIFTPDVPVKSSPVLMDRWSKKAETILDANGNLQVWRYAA